MIYSFKSRPLANYAQWAFYQKCFTPEECDRIISLFPANPEQASTIGGDVSRERKSSVAWLPVTADSKWIYDRIAAHVRECNDARWKFDLAGFQEPLQLTRYQKGEFYKYHQDIGPGPFTVRKLSVVVQLSDPQNYEGGELQFAGFENEKVENSRGSIILFPSFNPHRVTEVTAGERFSLVSWLTGEPYR